MDDKEYQAGNAAIFHALATHVAPIFCEVCGEDSAEFVEDYDKFEVYKCHTCNTEHWIAVR